MQNYKGIFEKELILEVLPIKIGDKLLDSNKFIKYKVENSYNMTEEDVLTEMLSMICKAFNTEDGIIILKDNKVYKTIWFNKEK